MNILKDTNKSYGLFITSIGILIFTVISALKHYLIDIPDFVYGVGFGIGFGIGLLGILSMTNKFYKFRSLKIKMLNKSF